MQIQTEWFTGAVQFKQQEKGIRPLRFSDKQLGQYLGSKGIEARSLCPAGITVDVLTDATSVTIDYEIVQTTRNWACFDLYINNRFVSHDLKREVKLGENSITFDLSLEPFSQSGPKQVTIYLPQLVVLNLLNIQFSNYTELKPAPAQDKPQLLCVGDSITQGMDALHPSLTYPAILGRSLNMDVVNYGVGGYIFNADSLDDQPSIQPDVITIAYGTNDWSRFATLAELEQKSTAFFEKIAQLYPESDVYVLTPIWREDIGVPKEMGTFEQLTTTIIYAAEQSLKCTIIDGLDLIPHIPKFYGDERVHPSDEGFLIMASEIARRMK